MKEYLRILFVLILVCGKISAQTFTDLKGNWKGVWNIDATNTVRFYLKITKSGTNYSGLIDDVDDGYNNVPADSISNNPPNVRFDFSSVGYIFQGVMNTNFTQITGTWTRGVESWPLIYNREPSVDEMLARTYSDGSGSLPYRLFIPTNYDAGKKYPLVLYLHGTGERGTDNRIQLLGQTGPLWFLSHENQAKEPCFLVAPQCPTGVTWTSSTRRSQLVALIATLKSEFNIDADRVYITGTSMGAQGTWEMLAQHGNLFAAGIPMSGYPGTLTTSVTAGLTYKIPIWNFHAADDSVVTVANSRNLINAIRSLGGTPVYTEFAVGDHLVWNSAYATPLLYGWMIAQNRNTVSNTPPFVSITSPSSNSSFAVTTNITSLGGNAGDTNARISSVTWTNNRGGNGTATGTTNWSIPLVNLQTGTNLVTVQATGTAWVLSYGGVTTFSDTIKIERAPLPILSVTRTNGLVKLEWVGGASPSLEKSTNLSLGIWETIPTGSSNSVNFLTDEPEAYFRIRSQ